VSGRCAGGDEVDNLEVGWIDRAHIVSIIQPELPVQGGGRHREAKSHFAIFRLSTQLVNCTVYAKINVKLFSISYENTITSDLDRLRLTAARFAPTRTDEKTLCAAAMFLRRRASVGHTSWKTSVGIQVIRYCYWPTRSPALL
jgi:hypothetical protein